MKIPLNPPGFKNLKPEEKTELFNLKLLAALTHERTLLCPTTDKGEYVHWDKLRHLQLPKGLSSEQWWFAIKLARQAIYKLLPFADKYGKPFVLAVPDILQQKLRSIDRDMGNAIVQDHAPILNTQMRDTYLVQSLIEEAITSSQLEGASTTRKVAKEMLRTQRKPRDLSERMIFNNYQAMQFIREIKNEALTENIILEIHRIVTKGALDNSADVGKFRSDKDAITVRDNRDGEVLHIPPNAKELKERIKKLCQFANATEEQENFFIHPVVKAILLHFILAYDHPFVDGNGRTARALFYWYTLKSGYWLAEFISISSILKKSPGQYAKAFLYTETDESDTTYFVLQQVEVILQAIKALYAYLDKQTQEIKQTEKILHANQKLYQKLNYRQIALIKHALKHPNMQYRIEGHRQSHNITYDTARTDLLNLAKLTLLIQKKMGKAFVFVAPIDLNKRINKL